MSDPGSERPLRIIHVVESLDDALGGLPAAAMSIASANARRGHHVTLVALGGPDDTLHGVRRLDRRIEVKRFLPARRLGRLGLSSQLVQWLRAEVPKADLVHTHSTWNLAPWSASFLANRHGVPLLISPHGSLDDFDLSKHRWAKKLLGPVAVRPRLARATVLCTSPHEERLLVTFGAATTTAVAMLPLEPAVEGLAQARFAVRKELGLGSEKPLLVFLGRIDYKKGLSPLIKALSLMSTPCHLVVAGRGSPAFEQQIRETAAQEGVADRTHFVGWVEGQRKADLMSAGDVFVLLSDRENYGMAAIEAVQYGLPLLVTDQVFAAEDLVRCGAGLITGQDPVTVAAALDSWLTDEGSLGKAREAARRYAAHSLDGGAIDNAYEAIVRSTITRQSSG